MLPKYAAVNGNRGPEIRCCTYWMGPSITAHETRKRADPIVHRMANFLGLTRKMGVNINAKHVANIAKAARLRPPKTSSRSHLLSANQPSSSSRLVGAGRGAPGPSVVGSLT